MTDQGSQKRRRQAGAPAGPTRRRRRSRRRLSAFACLLILFVVLASAGSAAVFSLMKIRTITVQGKSPYSQTEILSASGLKTGAEILLLNRKTAQQRITSRLPYIKAASVRLTSPTGLLITVTSDQAAFRIPVADGNLLVDCAGKILETAKDPSKAASSPVVNGISPKDTKPGTLLTGADADKLIEAASIIRSLKLCHMDSVQGVDVTNSYELSVDYDGRIRILIGTQSDIGYKLKFASYLLRTNGDIGKDEKGLLDVSQSAQSNKVSFIPA